MHVPQTKVVELLQERFKLTTTLVAGDVSMSQ